MKSCTAKFDKYTITIGTLKSPNKVTVSPMGNDKSTLNMLRVIAEEVGFEIKREWNTHMAGRKLVQFLNQSNPSEEVVYENVGDNN